MTYERPRIERQTVVGAMSTKLSPLPDDCKQDECPD